MVMSEEGANLSDPFVEFFFFHSKMGKITHKLGFEIKKLEHPFKDDISKFIRRLDLAQKQSNPSKTLEMEIKSLVGLIDIYEQKQHEDDSEEMNKYSNMLLEKTREQTLYIKEHDR